MDFEHCNKKKTYNKTTISIKHEAKAGCKAFIWRQSLKLLVSSFWVVLAVFLSEILFFFNPDWKQHFKHFFFFFFGNASTQSKNELFLSYLWNVVQKQLISFVNVKVWTRVTWFVLIFNICHAVLFEHQSPLNVKLNMSCPFIVKCNSKLLGKHFHSCYETLKGDFWVIRRSFANQPHNLFHLVWISSFIA